MSASELKGFPVCWSFVTFTNNLTRCKTTNAREFDFMRLKTVSCYVVVTLERTFANTTLTNQGVSKKRLYKRLLANNATAKHESSFDMTSLPPPAQLLSWCSKHTLVCLHVDTGQL